MSYPMSDNSPRRIYINKIEIELHVKLRNDFILNF